MGEIVRTIGATIEAIDEATNVFQRVEFSDRVRVDTFFPVAVLGESHADGREEVRSVRDFGAFHRGDAVGDQKSVQKDEFEVPP